MPAMGFEMAYQAIPVNSGLIELAVTNVGMGEALCLVPGWFRRGAGPRQPWPWPDGEALWNILCDLVRQHPGLEMRNCDVDRSWDMLHYLLSANRRDEPPTKEADLFDKAVRGATEIADHVRGTQGAPVKYVPPADVKAIGAGLQAMTVDSLRLHYDPVKMDTSCVYKFHADRAGEHWEYIAEYFAPFRAFYLAAARHGEGVIACMD